MPNELLATIVASKIMWLPSICVLGMSEKYSVSKDNKEIRAKKRVLLKLNAHLIYSNETKGIEPFRKCLNYKHQLVCCATYSDLFYQQVHNEFTNDGSMIHMNSFVSLFLKKTFTTRK